MEVSQVWFIFNESMLTTPVHFLVLHVDRNGHQNHHGLIWGWLSGSFLGPSFPFYALGYTSVMFASFQSSGISPDHHSISKIAVNCPPWCLSALSALVGASHQGPWTCGCQVCLTPTRSSLGKGKSSFKPSLSPVSWGRDPWRLVLSVMADAKAALTNSASSVNRVPLPFSIRPTLSFFLLL